MSLARSAPICEINQALICRFANCSLSVAYDGLTIYPQNDIENKFRFKKVLKDIKKLNVERYVSITDFDHQLYHCDELSNTKLLPTHCHIKFKS